MVNIALTPYTPVQNLSLPEVTINISKVLFWGTKYVEGKITFTISDCFFEKLIIENNDEIKFPDISIGFFNCKINDLQVEQITSSNISIYLGKTMVRGVVKSKNLRSVEADNCLVDGGLFLIDLKRVHITFSSNNLGFLFWRKVFRSQHRYYSLFEAKQSYYVYEVENFYMKSDLGWKNERHRLNLNVSLQYKTIENKVNAKIENQQLSSLSITGTPKGKIAIEDCKIDNWYVSEFEPDGDVTLYNISPRTFNRETKFAIHQCNLDEVVFDNVDFKAYQSISFFRTKFSKTIFQACHFPERYEPFENFTVLPNIHYPDRKPENYHKDIYEMFLQMKKALEGTGNYYEAQKMQAIAHGALRKVKSIAFSNRIILYINSFSNKHGTSIKRPFLWLISVSIVLYLAYLWTIDRLFTSTEFDPHLIGYYFSFIDLTHRPDFLVEKDKLNGPTLTLDFANKVVAGFFIYQFIAAFRKYGKS